MECTPRAWQNAWFTYEYSNYMAQLDPEEFGVTMPTNAGENPHDLDEKVFLKNKFTIPTFESAILHCCTQCTFMMGYGLQAMYQEDEANLPNGVYVLKTYTELLGGSWNVSVVLCYLMGNPDDVW